MRFRMMQEGTVDPADIRLAVASDPEIRWSIAETITEKSRRSNADHRERLGLNEDCGADDCGIGGILTLPCSVAEDAVRERTGVSSLSAKHAARVGAKA